MRQKNFYMPEEIFENLYTSGSEYQTEDGTEYRGLYHKYITNEIYTEPKWNPKQSKKLIAVTQKVKRDVVYEKLKTDLKTKFKTVQPVYPVITTSDIKLGYIKRYFLQKINDNHITEVDSKQYQQWLSATIDPNQYTGVELTWYISGTLTDSQNGLSISRGVRTKNLQEIRVASKTIIGLSSKLTNLQQYYTDTDFIIPRDINKI